MYFDLVVPKERTDAGGNKKTYSLQVGKMFPNRSGNGFTMNFDVFPIPENGKIRVLAFEAKPKNSDAQPQPKPQPQDMSDFGDEIPF